MMLKITTLKTRMIMSIKMKRSFLLPLIFLTSCAVSGYEHLPTEQQEEVIEVQDYLNNITSLQADFAQDGPSGQMGDGMFFYRPGALRMDYALPQNRLVVAHDKHLVIKDGATQSLTTLSLRHNPLGFLLHTPLNFSEEGVQVTNVRKTPDSLQISLAKSDNPSQGLLTIQFAYLNKKLTLIGIQGVDAQHHHFGLSLYDVKEGKPLKDDFFNFPHDMN